MPQTTQHYLKNKNDVFDQISAITKFNKKKFQKIKQKQVSIKQKSPGRVPSRAKITILRG